MSGAPPDRFTLSNRHGVEIDFVARGGIITSIRLPDRHGRIADIVPGFDTVEEYATDTRYMGALVGRYANRIAHGRFSLDGKEYELPRNNGENHLHGGTCGFSAKTWRVAPFHVRGQGAVLALESPAGDQGYPGTLYARVTYALDDENALSVSYSAVTNAPTVVNLTQHSYFNLAGHDAGDVLGHELTIDATYFTPVDERLIPTGAFRGVRGTPFDFLEAHVIGERIAEDDEQLRIAGGYDHNFILNSTTGSGPQRRREPSFAARLRDPESGRTLEIWTTEPGLQLYTGNTFDRGAAGKAGHVYPRHGAVALETQHFPDSPNQSQFPSTVLRPGDEFLSTTVYRFSAT